MGDRGKIQRWQGLLVGVLGGWGAIAVAMPAFAQLNLIEDTAGDRNLGTTVQRDVVPGIDVVRGGTRPDNGANVFHSFQEFNVQVGRGVYFENLPGIRNILSRVTGSDPSDILGTLGVLGTANLYLLNPNGIIFGENSALDVQGSFIATTANAIELGNTGLFSASSPASSNLLAIDPSALAFSLQQAQPIVNRAVNGFSFLQNQSVVGLQVPQGQSLLLVGGDVRMEGGIVQAPGGRVELGGLSAPGTVGLTTMGGELRLQFADGVARSDVALINSPLNASGVNVAAGGGGSIAIHARNLNILGGSLLQAGIASRLGTANSQAGNIILDVTEALQVSTGGVFNTVQAGATGNAGRIKINTQSLKVSDGGTITSSTGGRGNAGDISIIVQRETTVDGVGSSGVSSGIRSRVVRGGNGKGGKINVSTSSLSVISGGTLNSSTFGTGDAGDVSIDVRNLASFDGVGLNGSSSGVASQVAPDAIGKGGKLILSFGSLKVGNGAQLDVSTFGQGNAGDILITVREDAIFDGFDENYGRFSFAGSQVASGAIGDGGKLTLSSGSLTVINGAQLSSSTFDQGNAGDVLIDVKGNITFNGTTVNGSSSRAGSQVGPKAIGQGGKVILSASSLNVTNGARLDSSTFGKGDAGDISITVQENARFAGIGSTGFSSAVLSVVGFNAIGKGGNLVLNVGSLNITDGSAISSSTLAQGNAGDVTIMVRDTATFDGGSADGLITFAGSQVAPTAVGQGGTLTLAAGSLNVTNGAELSSSTFGQGDAGDVTITVRDAARFDGMGSNGARSGAGSEVGVTAVGQGGTLTLNAGSLSVTNGAELSSSTLGQGDAGAIVLRVRDSLRMNNGTIATSSAFTAGGSIDVSAQTIRLSGNSNILTSVFSGAGGGGNITLSARSIIALGDSDILAFARDGRGGNVTLNTRAFFGQNYRPAPFGTDPVTLDGNNRVDINATGTVSGIISLPDVSFIQNSLTQLSQTAIDTNQLLATSCIVRRNQPTANSFFITGPGGLPDRPGTPSSPAFPTGEIRNLATDVKADETDKPINPSATSGFPSAAPRPWQIGDPIQEPDGVYQLPNGELILSHQCR